VLIVTAASEAQFNNLCMLSAERRFEDLVNSRTKGKFKTDSQFLFRGIIFKAARRKPFKYRIHCDSAKLRLKSRY